MSIKYVDTPSKYVPQVSYEKINERINPLGYNVVTVYHPSWDGGFYDHALKKKVFLFIYKNITSVSIQNDTMFEMISYPREDNRIELVNLARLLNGHDIPTRLVKYYGGSIVGPDGKLIHLKPNEIPSNSGAEITNNANKEVTGP